MNKFGRLTFFTFCIFFNSLNTQINAQPPKRDLVNRQANQKTITLKLRDFYNKRDFEGGYELGKTYANQFPNNIELQTWFILNMARNDMSKEAILLAKELTDKNKDNGWAWFALANAYLRNTQYEEALTASEKALTIDPKNEEFIFIKALALSSLRKYEESYSFLDKNSALIKDKSRVFYANAESLYRESQITPGTASEAKRKQSFEFFAQSVKLDPKSVNGNYIYGMYLNRDKRFNEAYPILKKTITLSPNVLPIRQEFWKSLQGQTELTDEQKNSALIMDFDAGLKANPDSPKFIAAVAEQYGNLKNTEKRDFYENQILQRFPDTKFAEIIEYERISRLELEVTKNFDLSKMQEMLVKAQDAKTPEDRAKLMSQMGDTKKITEISNKVQQMRWDFIKRPKHFDEKKLGDVYFTLLQRSATNKNITDDQMGELIEGSLKYKKNIFTNVNSSIAELLVNSKFVHPNGKFNKDTEKYARAGIDEAENNIKTLPKTTPNETIVSLRGGAINSLGYVLMKENKLDEAEKELLNVQNMIPASSANSSIISLKNSNNRNLAQLYEAKKDYDKAEEYYLRNANGSLLDTVTFIGLSLN